MNAHGDGTLASEELRELAALVAEADDLDCANAPTTSRTTPGGSAERRAAERCEYCHAP